MQKRRIINSFKYIGLKKSDPPKLKEQKIFFNLMGLLMGLGGFVFGSICFFSELYVVSVIPFIYTVITIFYFIYFYISGNFKLTRFFQILFTILVPFSFHWFFGDIIPSGMIALWILLPLVCSIAVAGVKNTIRWLIFVVILYMLLVFLREEFRILTVNIDQKVAHIFFDLNSIMILSLLVGLMIYFIRNRDKANENLAALTESLERIVSQRTKELRENVEELTSTEEELIKNNEELQTLNEVVENKNTELETIYKDVTDSITIAKIIQKAILTWKDTIDSYFKENFILFEPKNIVSGDFYYCNKTNDKIIFTVADCIGHGVPGGFLTVLGISYLHEIVKRGEIETPAEVLEILRNRFKHFGVEPQICLDIALCFIDTKTNRLQYAGAFNPLFIIRDNEFIEYKASRNPVGFFPQEKKFENHDIQLKNNDTIYLFSDGFQDQFGGKETRKFTKKRFRELIFNNRHKSIKEQEILLSNTFQEWKGNNEQVDDVTIMAVKWSFE